MKEKKNAVDLSKDVDLYVRIAVQTEAKHLHVKSVLVVYQNDVKTAVIVVQVVSQKCAKALLIALKHVVKDCREIANY